MFCQGFDEGSPDGNDPLVIARLMASRGITLVCHAVISEHVVPLLTLISSSLLVSLLLVDIR